MLPMRPYVGVTPIGSPIEPPDPGSPRRNEADLREQAIRFKYLALSPVMDERLRRLWAGAEADALGEGGITAVERATGLSRTTIRAGRDELRGGLDSTGIIHVRRAGGGRPRLEAKDPGLAAALEALVEPVTRGDLESPLRWTFRSTRTLAEKLSQQGRTISPQKVAQLLQSLGYSLQSARRTSPESAPSPSQRGARFRWLMNRVESHLEGGFRVVAVTTATSTRPHVADDRAASPGVAPALRLRDPVLGQAIPCRVYDLSDRLPEPAVDLDLPLARFTVDAIERWWRGTGSAARPRSTELLVAIGDGAPFRHEILRAELQLLADRTRLTIGACHLPPGTVKWNRVEHRLVCRVSELRRTGPWTDHEVTVELIGSARSPGAERPPDDGSSAEWTHDLDENWRYTLSPTPVTNML